MSCDAQMGILRRLLDANVRHLDGWSGRSTRPRAVGKGEGCGDALSYELSPALGQTSDCAAGGFGASSSATKLMAEFKFSCPHCQQHLQCREEFSGRQIQCPTCQVLIRIPAVPGQTSQFAPESGMTWTTFVPDGVSAPPSGLNAERPDQSPPSR